MDVAKLKPYQDALVVLEDGLETVSPGGILFGQGQIEPDPWLTGRVFRIGDGKPSKYGVVRPPGFDSEARPNGYEPGDRVCFRRSAGMELDTDNPQKEDGRRDKYLLLKDHQVVPALLPDGYIRLCNPYSH